MSLKTIIIGTGTFMEVESNDPGEFPLNRVERKDKNHLIVHAVKIDGKWCVLRKIKEPALPKVRVIILNSHCGNITYMDELNRFYYTLNSVPGVYNMPVFLSVFASCGIKEIPVELEIVKSF